MENAKYVKARYLRNNIPMGPDYSFSTQLDLKVGDHVSLGEKHGKITKGVVSKVDVPFEEVEPFLDRIKNIDQVLEIPEIQLNEEAQHENTETDPK